jgi:AcrR family transcriptional regulator
VTTDPHPHEPSANGSGAGTNDRRTVDERREELLDAAIELLADEGLARTTTRAITERAGVALGAFHYAFRSKDELLQAVAERIGDHLAVVLADGGQGHPDVPSATVGMLEGLWDAIERAPLLHLAFQELVINALREPGLRDSAAHPHTRACAAIDAALRDLPDAPSTGDRDDLARYLLGTVEGLSLQALVHGDSAAARRRLALHANLLEELANSVAR